MTRAIAIMMALTALACDGALSNSGAGELLRVPSGFFREGELPGIPVDEQPEDPSELDALSPRVSGVVLSGIGVVRPGQAGLSVYGTTTEDAYSIAVRLADAGSGYWVKAVGVETLQPNEREWEARVDFSVDIEPGRHLLEIVAIDGEGRAGPQTTFRFCVSREVESTRNACDPTVLPPASAISLTWNNDADLDLVVVTPRGVVVEATHPTTLPLRGGETIDLDAPGTGVLSVDSNAACRRDGARRETLSWRTSPEPGAYEVYARLYEPCGARAVQLKVEGYVRTAGQDEGTYGFDLIAPPVHGLLLPESASGAADLGLFITTIEFP
jgi:hypothetical protein